MAEIPPAGFGPDDSFIPVGTFNSFNPGPPAGPSFHDPWPQAQDHNTVFVQPGDRYNDEVDLGRRISTLNVSDEPRPRSRSQRRNTSPGRRTSFLARRRSASVGKILKSSQYQLHKIRKTGEDWSVADVSAIPAPEKEIEEKMRRALRRNSVTESLSNMRQHRRGQVIKLLEEVNEREKDSDFRWEIASVENTKAVMTSKTTQDVREMDVVFKRSSAPRRPTQTKMPSESWTTKTSNLKDVKKKDEKDKKDDKGKGGDNKPKMKDTDPFGATKLFSSDGKPIDERGHTSFDNGGLPQNLPKDKPIGRIIEKPRSKSRLGRDGRTSGQFFGEFGGDLHGEVPPAPPDVPGHPLMGDPLMGDPLGGTFNMAEVLNGEPEDYGRGRPRRDSGVDILPLPIAQRGSLSRKRSKRRQDGRSRSRPASRPNIIYDDHYNRYPGDSSVSSDGDGFSLIHGEIDERSSHTSNSSYEHPRQRDYGHHRRYSSKHDRPTQREHYPGPTYYPPNSNRYHRGEQIMIPERRPTFSRANRPTSLYAPPPIITQQRAITNGPMDRSPSRDHFSPLSPLSPRRGGGLELERYYPSESDQDRMQDRYVDKYMENTRREQDLADREYRVRMMEQDLAEHDRERERRRSMGYFAQGGHNARGDYGRSYDRGDSRYRH